MVLPGQGVGGAEMALAALRAGKPCSWVLILHSRRWQTHFFFTLELEARKDAFWILWIIK